MDGLAIHEDGSTVIFSTNILIFFKKDFSKHNLIGFIEKKNSYTNFFIIKISWEIK